VLTFTSLQFVNRDASVLELPTDILDFPPDAGNFEKRFESDLVQTKEDGGDYDEKRGEQPHGHDVSVGVCFHMPVSIISRIQLVPVPAPDSLSLQPTTMPVPSYNFDTQTRDVIACDPLYTSLTRAGLFEDSVVYSL